MITGLVERLYHYFIPLASKLTPEVIRNHFNTCILSQPFILRVKPEKIQLF